MRLWRRERGKGRIVGRILGRGDGKDEGWLYDDAFFMRSDACCMAASAILMY
jgi:hypothetical protein